MSHDTSAGPDRRTLIAGGAAGGLLIAGRASAAAAGGPVATTANGRVRGYDNGPVKVFKGIPYAGSTAGAGRWMAPTKAASWTGVRDATALGPRSPQVAEDLIPEVAAAISAETMGEDCLSLNVWTPAVGAGKRPVMVWFHGGGYNSGSGGGPRYDGSNLARKRDVVVVTVNHRLNAFGYLYLAELGGPRFADSGAAGIMDLIAALRWVRDNIGAFGGDAGNVTIFGESGGGGKVTTLMASPAAAGLFHKAIAQSGVAMRHNTPEQGTRAARALMQKLGLQPNQVDQLVALPYARILTALEGADPVRGIGPVVDGRTIPTNPFDPAAPAVSSRVPMIIGSNLTETTFMKATPLDPIDDAGLLTRVKANTRTDDAKAAELIALYRRTTPGAPNHLIYQLMSSDVWLTVNVAKAAERRAALGAAPTFVYHFRKPTPVRDGKLNVPHTLDIPYVFDNIALSTGMSGDGPDKYALADKMSHAWTNFARTGSPDGAGLPAWPAYNPQTRPVMVLNDTSQVMNDPRRDERLAIAALQTV